jgi:Sigma-70 factor, region 1.1
MDCWYQANHSEQGILIMATLLYCWRCKTEKYMLGISEWQKMEPLLNQMINNIKQHQENPDASTADAKGQGFAQKALDLYFQFTGVKEIDVGALWHHQFALFGPECHSCKKPIRTPAAKVCAECGAVKPLPKAHDDIANAEHRRKALKALIKLGKDRGYLTRQELKEHLPEMLDTEQIESIAETFNEMAIKILDQLPRA